MGKLMKSIAGALIGLGSLGCPNSTIPENVTPNVTEQVMTDENEEQIDCTGERYFDIGVINPPQKTLEDSLVDEVEGLTIDHVVFVEKTGSDKYNGMTRKLAVRSIRRAVEIADYYSHPKIKIGDGTFPCARPLDVSGMVVQGNGWDHTTVNAFLHGNDVYIRDLSSQGATVTLPHSSGISAFAEIGIADYGGGSNRIGGDIRRCVFTDKAMVILDSTSNITLERNVFYHVGGG